MYVHTVYNNTVSLIEGGGSGGIMSVLTYLVAAAAIGGGVFAFMRSKESKSSTASAPVERGTLSASTSSVEDLVYTQRATPKAVRASSPRKRPKKA